MAYTMPMVIIGTGILFFSFQLTHMGLFRPNSKIGKEVSEAAKQNQLVKALIEQKYSELGPFSFHEGQVVFAFLVMIVLLFTQRPGFMVGWGDILKEK